MKITRFWAKGYRSLEDVTLDGLGALSEPLLDELSSRAPIHRIDRDLLVGLV